MCDLHTVVIKDMLLLYSIFCSCWLTDRKHEESKGGEKDSHKDHASVCSHNFFGIYFYVFCISLRCKVLVNDCIVILSQGKPYFGARMTNMLISVAVVCMYIFREYYSVL